MNSILKNLIVKEWFRFFFGSTIGLLLLITVANLISGFLRSNVTPVEVILNFIIELPKFFSMILPISCLIASIFSVNKLKDRNELTVIFASGFSRKDYILTILTCSLMVAFLQVVIVGYLDPVFKQNRDLLIPEGQSKFKNLKSAGLKASTIGSGKMWFKNENRFYSFDAYDAAKKTMSELTVYEIGEAGVDYITTGKSSVNISGDKWKISDGFSLDRLEIEGFPSATKFIENELNLGDTAQTFNQIESDITTLTVLPLFKYIERLDAAGINTNSYKVNFYSTFSFSLICIVFALLALMGIFNPNRRSSSFGKNFIFVFVFTLIYWLVNSYAIELGRSSKISPALACFLVPCLFLFFIIWNILKNRELR